MAPRIDSPLKLVVRCLAEKRGTQWQAFSLEFGLAVQADSFAEAKRKLDAMIQSYVFDALVGEDREHASELLGRKAHWRLYLLYHFAGLAHGLRRSMDVKLFSEPLGLEPKLCP